MEEIWKDIKQLNGMYQISSIGRVRSVDRVVKVKGNSKGRRLTSAFLKPRHDKDGYSIVGIRLNGKKRIWKIHRLVAECFIENTNNYPSVDHINGIRDDNRVENLRWCTVKQNCNFSIACKNKSEATKKSYDTNPNLRRVRAISFSRIRSRNLLLYKDGIFVKECQSQMELSEECGIPRKVVRLMVLGKIDSYNEYSIKIKQNGHI